MRFAAISSAAFRENASASLGLLVPSAIARSLRTLATSESGGSATVEVASEGCAVALMPRHLRRGVLQPSAMP
jgi:hypothetical protein